MRNRPKIIGPWTGGVDTESPLNHPDLMSGQKDVKEYLDEATNVVFSARGIPKRRPGTQTLTSITGGLGGVAWNGKILAHHEDTLSEYNLAEGTFTPLVSGLSGDRIYFAELGTNLFWTNGTDRGRVTQDGTAANWGMEAAPSPTLTQTAGSMIAGSYDVACTYEDQYGIESGAYVAKTLELSSPGAIRTSVAVMDTAAVYVNFYMTSPLSPARLWVQRSAIGSLPVTLSTPPEDGDRARPMRTAGYGPPPPGTTLFPHLGMLMVGRGNALYRSHGLNHHVFNTAQHYRLYPNAIVGGCGLRGGMYVTTESGIWWVAGKDPANWFDEKLDTREYAAGGIVVNGDVFRELPQQFKGHKVGVFLSSDGVVVALPDGTIMLPRQDRTSIDVAGKYATFAVTSLYGDPQLVYTLSAQ